MISELLYSPVARYTRKLTLIRQDEPDLYRQIVQHPSLDLKNLLEREFTFRENHERNAVLQIKGPTGSGKSIGVALPLCRMLNPGWRAKGNVFYNNDDIIQRANKAEPGSVIMKDEDPHEGGQGSDSVGFALANIESAVARFARLHFVFVNPGETSHLVNFLFDTSREESRRVGENLVAVVADVAAKTKNEDSPDEYWLTIGKIELQVPEEILVKEYKVEMKKFKDELRISGGVGIRRDIFRRYEYLVEKLKVDQDFQDIPASREGYFTGLHVKHISGYYGVLEADAQMWLLRGWRLVKIEKPPTARAVKKKRAA